jgi:selenide,water dikinase
MAESGFIPGGAYRNLRFYEKAINWLGAEEEKADWLTILFDPQTSGGLLIAVPRQQASALLSGLDSRNIKGFHIGEINGNRAGEITLS